ncbi:ABC transporter ATP-binding protein [Algivirga pacifica]|uniref:ABC transporter domain-containing protein n=1 Tax=Algivirga pacifica TaxID=1162670 RepID=A0ABP9DKW2_9BACT
MSNIAIKVENLSKQYRLGQVGTGTISHDLNRWWHRIRGKEDPYLKIGETNDRTAKGASEYVWALQDINFEVAQGEVLGIIGKNGAGKSTLLKVLSQITAPTTGSVKAKGRIASLLEVGTGFHPEMTGRENIYMNGTIMGMSRWEITQKLDEIVAFAGVERYLDTPVKRYSSGMTVRLGFAIAAHLEPEILIVDEVLAVGDAEFQKKAIGKMQEVSTGQGRTVLFVSHNMASIQQLCTRALVMEQGALTFLGDVNGGIDYYLSQGKEKTQKTLIERTDRQGRGNVLVSDVSFLSSDNKNVRNLASGGQYFIRMTLCARSKISNVKVRLKFVDDRGIIRFICNNVFLAAEFDIIEEGNYTAVFNIMKFPLPRGEYSIDCTIMSSDGIEDNIESITFFEVEGGDFFKTGRQQNLKEGVLVDHNFTVSSMISL